MKKMGVQLVIHNQSKKKMVKNGEPYVKQQNKDMPLKVGQLKKMVKVLKLQVIHELKRI